MGYNTNNITSYPWARGEIMLQKGELDILFTAVYSDKRLWFSIIPKTPIITSSWTVYSHKDNKLYTAIEDLKGRKIGLVRGYAYPEEFLEFINKNASSEYVSDDELNVRKLIMKRVDFIVMDKYNGDYLLRNKDKEKKIIGSEITLGDVGLFPIFSKKSFQQEFVDRFDAALVSFKETEDYKKLVDKFLK